jgi:hypothetical protein
MCGFDLSVDLLVQRRRGRRNASIDQRGQSEDDRIKSQAVMSEIVAGQHVDTSIAQTGGVTGRATNLRRGGVPVQATMALAMYSRLRT